MTATDDDDERRSRLKRGYLNYRDGICVAGHGEAEQSVAECGWVWGGCDKWGK
jgi:hypothetical protein